MSKNKKILLILATLMLPVGVFAALAASGRINKQICELRGGIYSSFVLERCSPKDAFAAAKQVLPGKVIDIPDKPDQEIKMKRVRNGTIEGYIRNKETKKETGEKVIAYVNKVKATSLDAQSFLMPFEIESKQGKSAYLGTFSFFSVYENKETEFFYKKIYLLNAYNFGERYFIDAIFDIGSGPYSQPVKILAHSTDTPDKQEQIILRYYSELSRYVEDNGCEGQIVNRERGDGKTYEVCIYENGNECAVEAYNHGNCPVAGYDISIAKSDPEKFGIVSGHLFRNGEFKFRGNYDHCTIDDFYYGRCEFEYKY